MRPIVHDNDTAQFLLQAAARLRHGLGNADRANSTKDLSYYPRRLSREPAPAAISCKRLMRLALAIPSYSFFNEFPGQ